MEFFRHTPWVRTAIAVLSVALISQACAEEKETCVLVEQDDGLFRLRCPDGSSGTFLPAKSSGAPARIEGRAKRLGAADNSGIEVILLPTFEGGTTRLTQTDEEGDYHFDEVVSGTYHLLFRTPSYPEVALRQRTVLPGTLWLDPLILRPTTRLGTVPASTFFVAPGQDAFAALEEEKGRLFYWDESQPEVLQLGERVSQPRWLPDGRRLLFLENASETAGTLVRYDRSWGTSESIMGDVEEWEISEDGNIIVARRSVGKLSIWKSLDNEVTTIVTAGLSRWWFHPQSKIVTAAAQSANRDHTHLLIWDALAATGSVLGEAQGIDSFQFDRQGERILYRTKGGHFVWSRDFSRPLHVSSTADSASMAPSGRFVILRRNGPQGVEVTGHMIDTGETVPIVSARTVDGFDPRTGDYWVVETTNPRRLRIFQSDGRVETLATWQSDQFLFSEPFFPRASSKVFFVLGTFSPPARKLWVWEPGRPSEPIVEGVSGVPLLVADDSHLLIQLDRPLLLDVESEEITMLRATGDSTLHVGDHAGGVVHYPLTPLFRPSGTIGPMSIYDVTTGTETTIVDEVHQESCTFSSIGSLFCMNRRSPVHPGGSQLIVWNKEEQAIDRIADGVFLFGFAPTGSRYWLTTQAPEGASAPMLWLNDESFSSPVGIDTETSAHALTESWIAYSIPRGSRAGIHVSLYPRPPLGERQ